MQELCDAVVEAEKAAKSGERQRAKRGEKLSRTTLNVKRMSNKKLGIKLRGILRSNIVDVE
jgi:hypothetical protein